MSYLFGGESAQSRKQTLNDLSQATFTDDGDPSEPIYTPENYVQGITTGPRIALNAAAGMAIPVSKLASGITKAIDDQFGTNTDDWWHKHVTQSLIHTSDDLLTPDPKTTHIALQIADQFATTAAKYVAVGGNPYLFGTITGAERAVREAEAGKPADTALQMGAIEGAANMLGAKLPPAIASPKINLPQTVLNVPTGIKSALTVPVKVQGAVTGAAINAGIGIPTRVATANALELGGYPEEAKQTQWNDPVGLGVDVGLGMLFGVAHQHMLPSHVDAILTANDARAIENPQGIRATNPAANNSLVDNMNAAVHALVNDEPVSAALTSRQRYEAQNIWHKTKPTDSAVQEPDKMGIDINAEPLQPLSTDTSTRPWATDDYITNPLPPEVEQATTDAITEHHNETNIKAVDSFIQDNPDLVNGLIERNYKTALTGIAEQAGWDTVGGQILRDEQGNVVGRTPWLPAQEWFGRFIKEGIGNKKDLEKAVMRFNEDKPLGPTQTKIIDWLKQEVDGNNLDQQGNSFAASNRQEDLRTQILDRMEIMQEQRAKQAENHKANLSGQNVYDAVLSQLQETGRFEIDQDEGFAQFMRHAAVTQAKRLGITPDDYYREYGAKIVSKIVEERNPEAFDQFAGSKANTANLFNLEIAKKRLDKGEDPEAIRQETGWFKGADGKMRFEIDDSKATLKPVLKSLETGGHHEKLIKSIDYKKRPDGSYDLTLRPHNPQQISDFVKIYGVKEEILKEILPISLVNSIKKGEGIDEFEGLGDNELTLNKEFSFQGFNALPLGDVIDHQALFAAYPQLKDVKVQVNPKIGIGGNIGITGSGEKVITVGNGQQLSTLLHEIQHGIQTIEGFARGGNPLAIQMSLVGVINSETGYPYTFMEAEAEGRRVYHRLAGEVEARNTQARANISDEKRTILPPELTQDTKNSDVVVVFNGKDMANAPMPENALPKSASEINLTGKELGELDHDNVVALAREWYRVNLQHTEATREGFGTVKFTGKGMDELRFGMKHDLLKAKLIPAIKSIIEIGDYHGRELPYKPRKDEVAAFHFFTKQLKVGDETVNAGVTVAEDAFGNLFYNVSHAEGQRWKDRTSRVLPRESAEGHNISGETKKDFKQTVNEANDNVNITILDDAEVTKGTYHPDSRTISLFNSADASTFLHESGHYFLDLYTDMIKSGVADDIINADMNHLLNWFGVDNFQTWARMSIDEQRPYHEQFAKGFETYLSEGTAPTPELLTLFQNLAKWLKQIYGDVQKALGITLNDDVRGVMARIIADGESKAQANDTPEVTAARQALASIDEMRQFEIIDDEGNILDTGTASELMARADAEAAFAEQSDLATQAAITCSLKWGEA